MNKIITALTLFVLCACGSPYQEEIGLTYNDLVIYYGAPVNETYVDGMRVATWIEHHGKIDRLWVLGYWLGAAVRVLEAALL